MLLSDNITGLLLADFGARYQMIPLEEIKLLYYRALRMSIHIGDYGDDNDHSWQSSMIIEAERMIVGKRIAWNVLIQVI